MNLSRFVINVQGISFKCIFFDMHDELFENVQLYRQLRKCLQKCLCVHAEGEYTLKVQRRLQDFYSHVEFYTTTILRFLLNYFFVVVYMSIILYRHLYNCKKLQKQHAVVYTSAFIMILNLQKKQEEVSSMVKICLEVDDKVWYSFKNYVINKYGKLKGSLGDEVSRALEHYLSQLPNAHTNKNVQQFLGKPNKRHLALLIYVLDFDEISKTDIDRYVIKNFGSDKRTRSKYLQFLLNGKFIEIIKPLYNNAIYKVNKEQILSFLKENLSEEEFKAIQPIKVEEEISDEVSTVEAAKAYAVERYEMGDSIDEIREDLADFGFELSKRSARNFVCNALREVRE